MRSEIPARSTPPLARLLSVLIALATAAASASAAPAPKSIAAFAAMATASAAPAPPTVAAPPATPKRAVEDRYWGRAVSEDYRWLEDWGSPEVRAWSEGENAVTREYLDHQPDRPRILERVTELSRNLTPAYRSLRCVHGTWFAIKEQPPKQQPLLVRLDSPDDLASEKVVLDPNLLDPSGSTAIDFFVPSLDGSKVAISLSKGGSESGAVIVVDGATGARLPDEVPRVQGGTAGGSVAWSADGRGFWHTRYPAPGERAAGEEHFWQQVYFHALGTPAESDVYALGKELPKIAEIALQTSDDGAHLLVDVRNGDGGEHAFWLRDAAGEFRQVARFEDAAVEAKFGDSRLYLLSRRASPNGAVLGVSYDDPVIAHARTVVAAGDTAIESIEFAGGRLYTTDIVGGPSAVRYFDPAGRLLGSVPLPPVCSVGGLVETSDETVLVSRSSFTQPPAWFRFDPARRTLTPTALAMKSPADFSDVEVRREFAVSRDGTKVPVNILMRKGTPLDGTAPALLTGYGGYGLSQRPSFNPQRRLWLDQGGIYVVANLRGGGEYGDAWHRAGNLTRKQNVFDDFAACARYLCERRYTSPERLACQGGSNGGLLMGAMLVQHPEQVRAVVSSVGIYDMLRVEGTPNGLFNVTEFGTVKDSAQFEALYAYSPYHHVRDGVKYPAVLFTTGANDPRVDPANSRKMTARLQAASASGHPVLLRTSGNVGHGIGSPLSERNALQADVFVFLLAQLGMRFIPPPPAVAP